MPSSPPKISFSLMGNPSPIVAHVSDRFGLNRYSNDEWSPPCWLWLGLFKTLRHPNLDYGLAGDPKPLRNFVQATYHPQRKIDIDTPLFLSGSSDPARWKRQKMIFNAN